MSIIADLIKYSRLAFGLRGFLHGTVTLEESKRVLAERLRDREKNFLSLVQKGIYQNPKSPFLKLLGVAGCEFGDIEAGVNKEGIEATLQKLLADGVYISWEEFKGRKEVVRGGEHFQFKQRDFDNPFLDVYYRVQSSGSRSAGTRTTFDLRHQLERSYYELPVLTDNNALDVPMGLWFPVLPAAAGTGNILRYWKAGKPVARWFSPVDERQVQSSLQHRLAMRYIIYGSWLWGAKLARPEYVGIEEAVKVAQWVADTKQQFGGCSFSCYVSLAVKVCQAAIENGLDIEGTRFFSGGEPLTPAKRQQIEAAGASVIPRYAISEIGRIGYGCPNGGAIDDVHLLHDSVALIQHRRKVEHADTYVDTFLFTPLLPSSPKILLNMESDDYGVVETRSCDCSLGQLGFNTHIHDIRSFAKLTGSGMTIVGTDLVRILEEVLPAKYGGAATDYQLLEEEDSQGQTHLSLIISPTVGTVDEDEVIATLLAELRRVPHPGKLTAGVWAQAKLLRVKRMQPISNMGKVMTLHLMKTE
ncbi:MAG: hypothetical protein HQ588_04780 [Deltaproteobacteria bacterium]|nr:hypothetical protein [Deltaproteobacteria bacterium]